MGERPRSVVGSEFGKVDFYPTVSNCVIMRGVFDFVGYSTMVDKALDVAEIVSMAVWTGHSEQR